VFLNLRLSVASIVLFALTCEKKKLFIFIDIGNSIIYDAPALEKADTKERLGLRKQVN
jgi:hypothetical protein